MAAQTPEILTGILHKEGLRYTVQREAVWDEIRQSQEHRDAEDIYLSLRTKGIQVSRATVYRTMDKCVLQAEADHLELFDVLKKADQLPIRGKQSDSLTEFYKLIKKYYRLRNRLSSLALSLFLSL